MLPTGREWERRNLSARERRIARADRWELVRSALRSAAAHGYYIFDALMTTEAGMIDFLAVGPVGTCVVVVRDAEGQVAADVAGTLYLNGRPFEDDPKRQAEDLSDDVDERLGLGAGETRSVLCFTRADLYYLGEDEDVLRGVSPTWDLALAFAEAPAELTPADVDELADRVRAAYGRPPFVLPEGEEN
jgi:hypothetical protein